MNRAFNLLDVVRVVRQPTMQFASLVGKRGYIDELNDPPTHAEIVCLTQDGEPDGRGAVPLESLEIETDSRWVRVVTNYVEYIGALSAHSARHAHKKS